MLELGFAITLALVFAWAGGLNLYGPSFVRDEFRAMGLPDAARIGVGLAEWLAALLVIWPATRGLGLALMLAILAGVVYFLQRIKGGMRLEYPLVLAALVAVMLLTKITTASG